MYLYKTKQHKTQTICGYITEPLDLDSEILNVPTRENTH